MIRGVDLSLNYAFDFGGGLLDLYYVASNVDEKVYEINSGLSNDCAGSWNSILGATLVAGQLLNGNIAQLPIGPGTNIKSN